MRTVSSSENTSTFRKVASTAAMFAALSASGCEKCSETVPAKDLSLLTIPNKENDFFPDINTGTEFAPFAYSDPNFNNLYNLQPEQFLTFPKTEMFENLNFYHSYESQQLIDLVEDVKIKVIENLLLGADGDLREEVKEALHVITERQLQKDFYGEIFGVISNTDGRLSFKIIDTAFYKKSKEALERFEEGSNDRIPDLRDCIDWYGKIHGTYLSKDDDQIRSVEMINDMLTQAEEHPLLFPMEQRRLLACHVRQEILSSFVVISREEISAHSKDFLGAFHVHKNGSPPSPPDLLNNLESDIPHLVISLTDKLSGSLYLLQDGRYKCVYFGSFQ